MTEKREERGGLNIGRTEIKKKKKNWTIKENNQRNQEGGKS